MLEEKIRSLLKRKEILLMTHIVIGYPDLQTSYQLVETMVENGADLMELQIPFSEPIADGVIIESANQQALAKGITLADCFAFTQKITANFPIPFLFMTYYNIPFRYGIVPFVKKTVELNLTGIIIPDLPIEEADEYIQIMHKNCLDPILLFAPTTPYQRMQEIAQKASGFIYCVARKGVTGAATDFNQSLAFYLEKAKRASHLPLALGFGLRSKEDLAFLIGKAEIAVIGSELLKLFQNEGLKAVRQKLKELTR